jgi:hypothetical protein
MFGLRIYTLVQIAYGPANRPCAGCPGGQMDIYKNPSVNVSHTIPIFGIITHISHNNYFCVVCIHFAMLRLIQLFLFFW